jgi:hypothetical protein
MNERCQQYLEDPEANAPHLAECDACRTLFGELDGAVPHQAVRIDVLPLAPWEGASYRSWMLVMGGTLGVLALAFALTAAAGMSLLSAVTAGIRSTASARLFIAGAADALRGASLEWRVLFGIVFVIVNAALVLLLRRPPRGVDA